MSKEYPAGSLKHLIRLKCKIEKDKSQDLKKIFFGGSIDIKERLRLREGGYFATTHRLQAGGLPTGNTISNIYDLVHSSAESNIDPLPREHLTKHFQLLPSNGPGPGGYEPFIRGPRSRIHCKSRCCRRCGRSHWSFECTSAPNETVGLPISVTELQSDSASPTAGGGRESASPDGESGDMLVCRHYLRGDHATAGCDARRCWRNGRWPCVAASGGAAGPVCRACGGLGHHSFDCHLYGSAAPSANAKALRAGTCPACRQARVAARCAELAAAVIGDWQTAGTEARPDAGPCGRHPAYLICSLCHHTGHFRCDCPAGAPQPPPPPARPSAPTAPLDDAGIEGSGGAELWDRLHTGRSRRTNEVPLIRRAEAAASAAAAVAGERRLRRPASAPLRPSAQFWSRLHSGAPYRYGA